MSTELLNDTFDAIDRANAADPTQLQGVPLAQLQGRLASAWLAELDGSAGHALKLAVRAHHLRRWEIARGDFPEGRDGYLRWRRINKSHQAESLALLLSERGWPAETIEQTGTLLSRRRLRSDPDTQTLEDAACLVFLETQFADMAERVDHDHLVAIVRKTLAKMSPRAVTLAGSIDLPTTARSVLADATTTLDHQEAS